jgi:hypothetical protein
MPVPNSANPAAGQNQRATYHYFSINMAVKATVTVKIGSVLQAVTYTLPTTAADGTYTPAFCELATTTENGLVLGVCIGGPTLGVAPSETKGKPYSLAQIMVWGYTRVRTNTSTTYGKFAVQSTATAGVAKAVTAAAAAKTIGVYLQAFTYATVITTVTALVKPT